MKLLILPLSIPWFSSLKSAAYVSAALALLSLFLGCSSKEDPKTILKRQDVVVIVVDTLAARYLGAYGAKEGISPNIDQLAREGVLFERAFSTAPWTKPSLGSLFTSLFPTEHGVKNLNDALPLSLDTMAEHYRKRGYETHGVVSHTLIDAKSGYSQGFDSYRIVPFEGNVHSVITSNKVTDMALEVLERKLEQRKTAKEQDKPLMLFVHYFDPHFNYMHHPQYDRSSQYKGSFFPGMPFRELRERVKEAQESDIEYLRNLYREEIAFTDFHLGRLLDYIKKSPLRGRSTVVFTADHGEEFMEHGGVGHTRSLYNELIHVPLIFWNPGIFKPAKVTQPVSLVDILPTLMAADSSIESDPKWRGQSLLKVLLSEEKAPPQKLVISEVNYNHPNIKANFISVIKEDWKLILDRSKFTQQEGDTNGKPAGEIYPVDAYELFNYNWDPLETENKASTELDFVKDLSAIIGDFDEYLGNVDRALNVPEIERTPEEVKQLESLGYM